MKNGEPRHFLRIEDFAARELRRVLARAVEIKKARASMLAPTLSGRFLAMIFEKPSTRTRLAFAAAMAKAGGGSFILDSAVSQLARGETLEDTARVVGRMADAVAIRACRHADVEKFASQCGKPVINALTEEQHPCQILADIMTFEERKGDIRGKRIAWIGDGNNVCRTLLAAAPIFKFHFAVAAPPSFAPPAADFARAKGFAESFAAPADAAKDADAVITDVWVSMGDDGEKARRAALAPYRVDAALFARAKPDAVFMHCLPMHRGQEVAAEIADGPRSAVWDEAENRMHTARALVEFVVGEADGAPR